MHLPGSKAEAVTVLAEAEADINAVRERVKRISQKQAFDKPDRLMAESWSQLDQGAYDKACSQAGEALEMVQAIGLRTETSARPQKDIHFVFPLEMQLSKKSNIREHPSMDSQIVHILDQGTVVTATGNKGHWIKITMNNQQPRWIYYSLLILPQK